MNDLEIVDALIKGCQNHDLSPIENIGPATYLAVIILAMSKLDPEDLTTIQYAIHEISISSNPKLIEKKAAEIFNLLKDT